VRKCPARSPGEPPEAVAPAADEREEPMMELLNAVFTLHLAHEHHERERRDLEQHEADVLALRDALRERFAGPCPDTYATDHPWREAA
jgi:hypothetical protein